MEKVIDTESWYRKKAYDFFKGFADPFFNMTANVQVTSLHSLTRDNSLSFSASVLYYSQLAANSIPEMRTRIRGDKIVEFERLEATHTLLQEDESFTFCHYKSADTLVEFCEEALRASEFYKDQRTFDVETERLDLVYYSVIPWISFTSFKHASTLDPTQSVPRIVFGKYFESGDQILMPVSVEGNHIVMDGIHVGKYFNRLEGALKSCSIDD